MDWLEEIAEEFRKRDPAAYADAEARAAAEGGGWVVERPDDGEDGEIMWVVVAEGD